MLPGLVVQVLGMPWLDHLAALGARSAQMWRSDAERGTLAASPSKSSDTRPTESAGPIVATGVHRSIGGGRLGTGGASLALRAPISARIGPICTRHCENVHGTMRRWSGLTVTCGGRNLGVTRIVAYQSFDRAGRDVECRCCGMRLTDVSSRSAQPARRSSGRGLRFDVVVGVVIPPSSLEPPPFMVW